MAAPSNCPFNIWLVVAILSSLRGVPFEGSEHRFGLTRKKKAHSKGPLIKIFQTDPTYGCITPLLQAG